MTKVKAAIYTRISKDLADEAREEKKQEAGDLTSRLKGRKGVQRQAEDCHTLATKRGYVVVGEFEDNDISASAQSRRARPEYAAMLKAVRSGQVDVIVAYSNSRLTRRMRELLDLIDLHAQTGVKIETVVSGSDDLSTADGIMVAQIKASVDEAEARRTAERAKRAKAQAAGAGKYRGGPRPFGFENDGVTVREEEARVIREATKAILAGRSLKAVAHELNGQGVLTSTGRPWTYQRLRDVLIRPRNAGLIHRGRADRRTEGREDYPLRFEVIGRADWPAIVDEDTWRACATTLLDPSRRIHTSTEPRWLGSRSYVCGIEDCGALMRPTSKVDHVSGCPIRNEARVCDCPRRYYYRCSERNHLTIAAVKTDEFVRQVVTEVVRDPRVAAAMEPSSDGLAADKARRQVLVTSLEQTEMDYDGDLIDARRFKAKSDRITGEIGEIDERLTSGIQRSLSSKVLRAPDPGAAFKNAPVDIQRAVLRSVLTVTVRPTTARGMKWSSGRLRIAPVHPTAGRDTLGTVVK